MNASFPSAAEIQERSVNYIAQMIGSPASKISVDEEFSRLGLDSTGAVALLMTLEEWLDHELVPEILFEYTSIRALSEHLHSLIADEQELIAS